MVRQALDEFGRLDILVNNAGIIRNRTFLNIGPHELEPVFDVHVKGTFFVTRPAYEHMKQRGYGRIVNTSSGSAVFGSFGQSAYAAAKAAIMGMTKTLALEGRRYGIAVNALAPGALTRMTGDVLGEDSPGAQMFDLRGPELEHQLGPRQIARVVAYLAHRSCSLTGETLSASGGRVGRVFVGVTPGIHANDLTPEIVAERLSEILDESGYLVPTSVDDEFSLLLSFLRGGAQGDSGTGGFGR